MIHLIIACSWCNTKWDLPSTYSDMVVVSDHVEVVWSEGEPYVFCCPECRANARLELT